MGDVDVMALVEDVVRHNLGDKGEDVFQFCRRVYSPSTVPISYPQFLTSVFLLVQWGRIAVSDDNKLYLPS